MNWTEYYMRHQYLASEKSKDPSTKIGAVLVRGDNIVSIGYNGFPRGINDSPERLNNREEKYFYVVHAESNAILNAARNGIATKAGHGPPRTRSRRPHCLACSEPSRPRGCRP